METDTYLRNVPQFEMRRIFCSQRKVLEPCLENENTDNSNITDYFYSNFHADISLVRTKHSEI